MFTKQPLRTRQQSRRSTMPFAENTSKVQDKKSNESFSPTGTRKTVSNTHTSLYEPEKRLMTKSFSRRGSMPLTTTASSRQVSVSTSTSKQKHGSISSSSSCFANTIRPNNKYLGMNGSIYGQLYDSEKELLGFQNLNIDSSNTMDCSYSSMEQSFSSMLEQSYTRTLHDSFKLGSSIGGKRFPSTTNQCSFRETAVLGTNTPIRTSPSNTRYLEEKIRCKSTWDINTNTKSQESLGSCKRVVKSNEMLKETLQKVSLPYRHHNEISFVPQHDEVSTDSGSFFDFDSSSQLHNSKRSDYPSIVVVVHKQEQQEQQQQQHEQLQQQQQQKHQHQYQPESQRVHQQVHLQQQQQQQQDHIELLPGFCLPLLGKEQTQEAIRTKQICACYCFSCSIPLCCCIDAEYVLCPDCYVVSPINDNNSLSSLDRHRRTSTRNIDPVGSGGTSTGRSVGFGVKTVYLSQSQRRILDQ